MRKNASSLSALFVAIAASIAASAANAEMTPGPHGQNGTTSTLEQGSAATQAPPSTRVQATNSQNHAQVTKLGTVTVTANKRDETLQNIAAPVSVLTYFDIQRQQMQSFADYVTEVPGFNYVSLGAGRTELTLRGIASGSTQPSASVGVYIDDSPFGSSSVFADGSLLTPDFDPSDLARIEVLRGPQGTLYGAGSLGGVIRFITIPPDTHAFSGRLQVDGASIDGGGTGFGARGMVNLPLVTDKLALRVNVYDRTDPGFIADAGQGKTNVNVSRVKGGRASLLWAPTDSTSLRLTAMSQNLNSDGDPVVDLDPTTLTPVFGDLQQRRGAGTGTFDARYRLYNATLKTDFGFAKFVSSSTYSTLNSFSNLDVTPLLPIGIGVGEQEPVNQTKSTQEFRLVSPKLERVEWLGGVFFTHETGSNMQHIYPFDYTTGGVLPSPFGMPIGDVSLPSTYDAYAVYGSLTWHVTDRFDVETGLRYSRDRQHFTQIESGALVGGVTTILDNRSSDTSTTYSLTPRFHLNETTLLYARAASGFLPGGPNVVPPGIPGVSPTFSPTQLTDYEIGLKKTALNDRLTVDLSAFYIDWTKIPLTTFVSPYSFLGSAGKAKSQGLEATIDYIPTRGLRLAVNASYTDPRLTVDTPPPANGKAGDRLPYIPKWNVSFNGDYDFRLGGGWNGFVGATYRFVGSRETDFNFTNTPRTSIPSYHSLDLRVGANHDVWTLEAYVKNVTNERGIVLLSGAEADPITGKMFDEATIITPRLLGISVSRNF